MPCFRRPAAPERRRWTRLHSEADPRRKRRHSLRMARIAPIQRFLHVADAALRLPVLERPALPRLDPKHRDVQLRFSFRAPIGMSKEKAAAWKCALDGPPGNMVECRCPVATNGAVQLRLTQVVITRPVATSRVSWHLSPWQLKDRMGRNENPPIPGEEVIATALSISGRLCVLLLPRGRHIA